MGNSSGSAIASIPGAGLPLLQHLDLIILIKVEQAILLQILQINLCHSWKWIYLAKGEGY